MAVDLPIDLGLAVERLVGQVPRRELARATATLSGRYRSRTAGGAAVVHTRAEALGYVAYRLPATYAAITAALAQVRGQRPGWHPRTLLDLGAGPGTGLWAAVVVWQALERATALDTELEMIRLGQELAHASRHPAVRDAVWLRADLSSSPPPGMYDLVLIAYVLGELPPRAIDPVVEWAWNATAGTLAIIEPGTPAGYERVLRARTQLLARDAHVTAPCPHDAACPLLGRDWCHFGVRLPRSKLHRAVKGGELGYEDEKFSFVAVSRTPTLRPAARVIRHPRRSPGRIELQLCTRAGVELATVTRGDQELFRWARKAAWGDGVVRET